MSKKTLIIDDTKNIRLMLTKCLELNGWEVMAATNGKEGFEAVCNNEFDLIFLDLKLPEVSGVEVLKRIRDKGILTPVIVITAYPTIKNALECSRLGIASYIQKPFSAERLLAVLNDLELSREKADSSEYKRAAGRALEEGKLSEAWEALKSALSEDPCDGEVYRLLTGYYQAKGDLINAEKFKSIAKILID